jgi:fucose 4-O-acetylase-like acetyltransferase
MATDIPSRPRLHDLVEATPSTRNRYVDLIRVVSIAAVVLGHWTMAVIGYRDGRFTGANLLELDPDTQILTWLFMVMPLFFIVGGFSNGGSWLSARRRGVRYADWLAGRSARLLRPALWFVAFWALVPVLGVALGLLSPSVARTAGEEVALPLWFLAVYLLAMVLLPPLIAAHERWGAWTLLALVAGVVLVDIVHFGLRVGWIGTANYVLVWMSLFEIGLLWRDGAFAGRRWLPWAMIGIGLATLVVLVTWFDYPVSMTGLTHATRSNAQPPTLALLALGVWQFGLALLFEPAANRWLAGRGPWTAVVAANSMVMTLYLWNMSAVVVAALLLFRTGIAPQPEPLSTTWWALRPAWWVACAICLVPFVLAFRWTERPASPPPLAPAGRLGDVVVLAGTIVAGAGLGAIAARAFPVPGAEPLLVPAVGVAMVGIGAALLRMDPVSPLRHAPANNDPPTAPR